MNNQLHTCTGHCVGNRTSHDSSVLLYVAPAEAAKQTKETPTRCVKEMRNGELRDENQTGTRSKRINIVLVEFPTSTISPLETPGSATGHSSTN